MTRKAAEQTTNPQQHHTPGITARLHAWMHHHFMEYADRHIRPLRARYLAPLRGDVLELGPGAGINLPHLHQTIRWTGVEPNPYMHRYARQRATPLKHPIRLLRADATRIPLPDESFDAVVAVHVLCTIADPDAALREARRLLRPSGRLIFIEHVAGPPGSPKRRRQQCWAPLWRRLTDGCNPDRDTAASLRNAGFAELHLHSIDLPYPLVGPHIHGWAVRP